MLPSGRMGTDVDLQGGLQNIEIIIVNWNLYKESKYSRRHNGNNRITHKAAMQHCKDCSKNKNGMLQIFSFGEFTTKAKATDNVMQHCSYSLPTLRRACFWVRIHTMCHICLLFCSVSQWTTECMKLFAAKQWILTIPF